MPLSLVLDGANRHDSKLFKKTLENYVLIFNLKACHLCGDKGYDSEGIRDQIREKGMIPHIRSRGEEAAKKRSGISPKRWVIERTMSWINCYRKLKIRYEKKSQNYEALCHFAFSVMAFRAAGVLG